MILSIFRYGNRQRGDRYEPNQEREEKSRFEKREKFEETFQRIHSSQMEENESSRRQDSVSDKGHRGQRGFGISERSRDEISDEGQRGFGMSDRRRNEISDEGHRGFGISDRRDEISEEGHRGFGLSDKRRDEISDEGQRGFGMSDRRRDEISDERHRGFPMSDRRDEISEEGHRGFGMSDRRDEFDEGQRGFPMSERRRDEIFMDPMQSQTNQLQQENIPRQITEDMVTPPAPQPILAVAPHTQNTTVITVPQQIRIEPQMQQPQVQVIQTLPQEAGPPPQFQPQVQATPQIVQLSAPPPQGDPIVHIQASNTQPGEMIRVSQPAPVQTIITQPQPVPQTMFTSPPPQPQQIIVSPTHPQMPGPSQQISVPAGPPPGHHPGAPPPPAGPPPHLAHLPQTFTLPPSQVPSGVSQQMNVPPPPPVQQPQSQMTQSLPFPAHSSGVYPQQTQVTVIHASVAPPQIVTNTSNIHSQIIQAPPHVSMAPPNIVTSAPNMPPQIIQNLPPSQPQVVQVPSPAPQHVVNLQQPPPALPSQQITLPPGPPPPSSIPSFIQIQQTATPPPQLVTSQQTVLISQPVPQVPVSQSDIGEYGQRLAQPPPPPIAEYGPSKVQGIGEYGPGPVQVKTLGEYGPVPTGRVPAAPPGMRTVMGEYGRVMVKEEPQTQNEYGPRDHNLNQYGSVKTESVNEYGSVTNNVKGDYGFPKQENGEHFRESEKYDPFRRSESQESDYDPAMPTEGDSPGKTIITIKHLFYFVLKENRFFIYIYLLKIMYSRTSLT